MYRNDPTPPAADTQHLLILQSSHNYISLLDGNAAACRVLFHGHCTVEQGADKQISVELTMYYEH